jgi:hypothetical protein
MVEDKEKLINFNLIAVGTRRDPVMIHYALMPKLGLKPA